MTLQAGIGAGIRVRRWLLFAVCLPSVRCALLRAKVNNSLITDAGGGLATSPAPVRPRLQAFFCIAPTSTSLQDTACLSPIAMFRSWWSLWWPQPCPGTQHNGHQGRMTATEIMRAQEWGDQEANINQICIKAVVRCGGSLFNLFHNNNYTVSGVYTRIQYEWQSLVKEQQTGRICISGAL